MMKKNKPKKNKRQEPVVVKPLPCPFCGGRVVVSQAESSWIECESCGIESPVFESDDEDKNYRDVVKWWNRRKG